VLLESGLAFADAALKLFVFILATIKTKTEVLGMRVVSVGHVQALFDVLFIVELIGSTALAFKTLVTFPVFWDVFDLRGKTERMDWSIAMSTEH